MAFRDIRGYISSLVDSGEAIRIKEEIDWDLGASAIVRLANQLGSPAPIMENIKDYPGCSLAGALFSNYRRAAIAIGLDPDLHPSEILNLYHRRSKHPIKSLIVDKAPCQENVITGDDINLLELCAPYIHEGDGGRYLGSWQFIATPDYDTDWINWGMCHLMVHNETTLGGLLLPQEDIGIMFYGKYLPNKKPMPWAAVIGTEPLTTIVSAAPYGRGKSEVDWAGGLRLEPVELVKCVSQPLYVPANAEIIIEGVVDPDVLRLYEGPVGEYTGYRTSPRMPRVAYRVTAITFRNNPINCVACLGVPTDDSDMMAAVLARSDMLTTMEINGIPVVDISIPPQMVSHAAIVSVGKPHSNVANRTATLLFGTKNTGMNLQQLFVCDEDIDVFDIKQVLHAFATKCHPKKGITYYDNQPATPLLPHLSYEDRLLGRTTKVVFDCTWPLDWSPTRDIPVRGTFWDMYAERTIEKICNKWQEWGYPQDMKRVWEEGKERASWKKK